MAVRELGAVLDCTVGDGKGGGGHVDTYNGVLQLHTFYSYFSHIKGLLLSSVNDISVHNLASYYKAAKHLENVCSLFIS